MKKRLISFVAVLTFAVLVIPQGSVGANIDRTAYAQADPDAIVHLPLDEGSGTVAADVSGSGNDGTLVNGATFEAGSADGSPSSVRFDGVDDRIDLGALDVSGSGLTLAAWFNANSFPGPSRDPRIISKASGTNANDHVFMLGTIRSGSAVRLRARVRVGGAKTTTLIPSNGNLQIGVWQHTALTYDGTTLRLYLDGEEVGSTPLSGAVDVDPSLPVAVGNQPDGAGDRSFDGLLDDVRILQRGMSASEIAALASGSSNPPPVAGDDAYTTDEDTPLPVDAASGVLVNDSDPELQPLEAILVSDVSSGVLTLNSDGSFDYTPDTDFNGEDSFTYQASDGSAVSTPATVTLTVNPLNDSPLANDDNYQTAPETPLAVNAASGVLANDTDIDGDLLQAVLVDDASSGVLTLNSDGSFDYTPNSGFSGQDSFSYYANDSLLDSNLATVTLTIEAPPQAVDDSYSTAEDTPLVVTAAGGVLTNDVDNKPPQDLTVALAGDVSDGVLNLNPDGSFDYTPNLNFNGEDSFTYEAVDGLSGASSLATVTLTVTPVNDAPAANDEEYQAAPETTLVVDAAAGVLANDSDSDGDLLQAVLDSDVSNGVLTLNNDGSFDYSPNAGFSGEDSFTYYANDALLDSNLATVTISVGSSDAIVHLPLDEGSGTVAADVSGSGNDGTLVNGALFEVDSADGSPSSVRFDGVDDRIDLGALDVSGSGLTLAAWFKADSFPGTSKDPRIISKASGVNADDHVFMLGTIGQGSAVRLRARVRVGGATTTLIPSHGDLQTGVWQHTALTYDGTTLRLYLDGEEVGSTPLSGAVDVDPSLPVAVGNQPDGAGDRSFDGLLDDMRILQRGMSASEIAGLSNIPVPTYTVTASASGNGTILLDPDQPDYEKNTLVSVTAVPTDGWYFVGWSGDLSGTINPAILLVDDNKSVTATFSSDPPVVGEWWDNQWSFRLPITVNSISYSRTDQPAEVELNITEAWNSIGVNGELDLNSLRVIEVDSSENILDTAIPFQFDPSETYDASTNAAGKLTLLLKGNTDANANRAYHVYFDDTSKSLPAAVVSQLVTVTDHVTDEGLTTYRIDSRKATYYYDKQGGGFSSLVDSNGNDWINYNNSFGASGKFRGIPNLVYPEGYMHPGDSNVVSTILYQGPLKITIQSTSSDTNWRTLWEIYPDFARLTVLRTNHNYWFLYEGTPGGVLDVASDIVVRADGTQTFASESWTGDLIGDEWVYFGDPVVGGSVYFANHQEDTAVDSYYAMEGEMTVFGFGRQVTNSYLNQVPATFTVGLVDDTTYSSVADEILASYKPLATAVGVVEVQN